MALLLVVLLVGVPVVEKRLVQSFLIGYQIGWVALVQGGMVTTYHQGAIITMIPIDIRAGGEILVRNGLSQLNSLIVFRTPIRGQQQVLVQLVQVRQVITVNVSEAVLSYVSRVIHLVFGSKRLRHYEQECIAAWRSTLSEVLQKKLDKQLEKFDLVQRQANGTKSVFYSVSDPQYTTWKENDLFPVFGEEQKVFTGTLIGNIGDVTESVQFSVYLHKGRLSSIEFVSELGALASLSKGFLIDDQKTLVDFEGDRGRPKK